MSELTVTALRLGLLALLCVALTLGSGTWWVFGGSLAFADFNLLNWHILLGFLLAAVVLAHLLARAKRLRKRDVLGRRRALHFGSLLLGGVALWPFQQFTDRVLHLPGASERFTLRAPSNLAKFIAEKGSVCLDGTSLTVNSVRDDLFSVLLIPHTLQVTTWGERRAGDRLNLEVDLIARYAARLSEARAG